MKISLRFKSAIRLLKETAKRLLHPEEYKSVGFFCDYLGDEITVNDSIKSIRRKKVTTICTLQSDCPPKDNACLVYTNPVYGINDMQSYAARAMSNRNSLRTECFDSLAMVSDRLRAVVASGDLVLFKASNASNLKDCVLSVWPETEPCVNNKTQK